MEMLSTALALAAGAIWTVTFMLNLLGLLDPWSWVDLVWDLVIASLLTASWWLGERGPFWALTLLALWVATGFRVWMKVRGSR